MTRFAGYDVLAKWDSLSFDEPTREALRDRLQAPAAPQFLTRDEWDVLRAVIDRLLPQPDRERPIPVAAWIDALLAENGGEGYRDVRMPPMRPAWRAGLAGIEEAARSRFQAAFINLSPDRQDAVLRAVQAGEVDGAAWKDLDPVRFFRDDLLKTAAGLYYAHPDAWSEIGFGGPASPRGYVRLGFNEVDPWEAQETP
jgi:hypothetical protein